MLHDRRPKLVGNSTVKPAAGVLCEKSPAAPRAGAELTAARERLDWALEAVAAELHIRVTYLQALEAGRIGELPGNAYAVGYLRSYAAMLGLDPAEMVRRFKAEAAEVSQRTRLAFPVPAADHELPAGALGLLGLALVVIAYAGWYRLSGEGRLPTEAVMVVPERLASLAEQALPPVARAVPPPIVPPPIIAAVPGPPPGPDPIPPPLSISPGSAAAALVSPMPGIGPPASAAPDASTAAGLTAAGSMADQTRIVLRASADAWIQVRERNGSVLLNRVLKAGETWPVPPRPNLLLTLGNAGGTDIVLDGVALAGLGALGMVRRDLPLDPDAIKEGKLSVAAPATVTVRR